MIIVARAWLVEHLSTSHRNDSHDPAGSHYFTTPVSHGNLLVLSMMIAVGLYEHSDGHTQKLFDNNSLEKSHLEYIGGD